MFKSRFYNRIIPVAIFFIFIITAATLYAIQSTIGDIKVTQDH